MFNNLLVQRGYIVLDMEYRGSAGYGRDWRTAIYRQMGHPELDDYRDGIDWLVANQQAERSKVGIRSEEHTSELQSLMRISYAVFCLKKKNKERDTTQHSQASV